MARFSFSNAASKVIKAIEAHLIAQSGLPARITTAKATTLKTIPQQRDLYSEQYVATRFMSMTGLCYYISCVHHDLQTNTLKGQDLGAYRPQEAMKLMSSLNLELQSATWDPDHMPCRLEYDEETYIGKYHLPIFVVEVPTGRAQRHHRI